MIHLKKVIIAALFICLPLSLRTTDRGQRDILFEAKGSLFVPTTHGFKTIYGNCGDFGLELTGKLFNQLYAFASADFIAKDGETIRLGSITKINILNLGLGLKYFVPFNHGDFYFGLGIEPTSITIKNKIPSLLEKETWCCGGIAKVGVLFDISESFFTDIFCNYSFIKTTFYTGMPLQVNQASFNGCLFGVGIGYRFN